MNKDKRRKLTLKKETLRDLKAMTPGQVKGGVKGGKKYVPTRSDLEGCAPPVTAYYCTNTCYNICW